MTSPRTITPDFHGSPGPSPRVLARTARDAGRAADADEPEAPPKQLPSHSYGPVDRKRRGELLDQREINMEEQRFNAELDWEMYCAQGLAMEATGEATDNELKALREAERGARLRVISLDAVLARLKKKKI